MTKPSGNGSKASSTPAGSTRAGVKHLWGPGARFARWYDLPTFRSRILDRARRLGIEVFHIDKLKTVDPQCLPYFVVFEKIG
jgi:hypothetical protein